MLKLKTKTKYEKDIKRLQKQGKNLKKIHILLLKIIKNEQLQKKYKKHKLKGNYADHWECHIESDWLLIYLVKDDEMILVRTGSHSELFNK